MKRILLWAAVSAFATLPAFAADLGVIEAPVPDSYMEPAFSWTGLYVGINGGGAFGDVEPGNSDSFDIEGGIFGAQIGYNYDLGGFVLGAEADIQWSGMEGDVITGVATAVTADIEYFGTVRARAGVAIDRALLYGTGGFAWARASGTSSFGPGYSTELDATGFTVGAGVEYAFTDNVTAKAEYLYTSFGEEEIFEGTPIAGEADVSFHTVRAGLNFKF